MSFEIQEYRGYKKEKKSLFHQRKNKIQQNVLKINGSLLVVLQKLQKKKINVLNL